ncbi:MAG: hypothetical protein IPL53_18535 [Ignavibacteria bacterium]|nr:hypothetical protein [Ignavibacteria bacterium]
MLQDSGKSQQSEARMTSEILWILVTKQLQLKMHEMIARYIAKSVMR